MTTPPRLARSSSLHSLPVDLTPRRAPHPRLWPIPKYDPSSESARKLEKEQIEHKLAIRLEARPNGMAKVNCAGLKRDGRLMLRSMRQTWEQHMAGVCGNVEAAQTVGRSGTEAVSGGRELSHAMSGTGIHHVVKSLSGQDPNIRTSAVYSQMPSITHSLQYGLRVRFVNRLSMAARNSMTKEIWSDASTKGMGGHLGPPDRPWAVWNEKWVQEIPERHYRVHNTNLVEAMALLRSLTLYERDFRSKDRIVCHTDSGTIYQAMLSGQSADLAIHEVIQMIHRVASKSGVTLVPRQVVRKDNTTADKLSKGQYDVRRESRAMNLQPY